MVDRKGIWKTRTAGRGEGDRFRPEETPAGGGNFPRLPFQGRHAFGYCREQGRFGIRHTRFDYRSLPDTSPRPCGKDPEEKESAGTREVGTMPSFDREFFNLGYLDTLSYRHSFIHPLHPSP